MPEQRFRGKTKVSQFKFREGGRQTPQEAFNITTARETAQRPFDIEAEERSIDISGRKKLIEKAIEDSGRLQGLLPVIDELENRYRVLYPNAEKFEGPAGIKKAVGTSYNAFTQTDKRARSLLNQIESLGATFAKALGDTGNIARVEREDSLKAIAKLAYNPLRNPLDFPDAPASGVEKFSDFRRLLLIKLAETDRVIKTNGEVIPESYREKFPEFFSGRTPIPGAPGSNSGIEQERQQALEAINKGADGQKVRDMFRSRTGKDL